MSTTYITDVTSRTIRSDDLDWATFHVLRAGERLTVQPVRASASYFLSHSPAPEHANLPPSAWLVSAHVSCRRVGRGGRMVDEWLSAEFRADAPDVWPEWLRLWVDLHHPGRVAGGA